MAKKTYRDQYWQAWRDRNIQDYLDAHGGEMPYCECGCGNKIENFDGYCVPRRFLKGHFHGSLDSIAMAHKVRRDRSIEVEPFRQAMLKIKERNGWTLRELAEHSGVSKKHLESVMYDKKKKHVTREYAVGVLSRLAGKPVPPSTYQKKRIANITRAERQSNRHMEDTVL
jgi:lambda repressor-like predicted transcriptional regulator